jgi:carbamoyl-phosphate synthase large subunit
MMLPTEGTVLITVAESDRPAVLEAARQFGDLGFRIKATRGTHRFLTQQGIGCERINKLNEGRPDIVDGIKNKEIHLIINTPSGRVSQSDDSYIRKSAVKYKVPYITTLTAALAAAKGIAARREGSGGVRSLQSYHQAIAAGT